MELKELPKESAAVSELAVDATGDFEDLENADTSVRAALLGKANKRAFTADKTTAQIEHFDIDMSRKGRVQRLRGLRMRMMIFSLKMPSRNRKMCVFPLR